MFICLENEIVLPCLKQVTDQAFLVLADKNLFLYTKMRNVAGLSTSDAQKSSDMFAKCRYMDEITGNRGVIFATGTPVSNSMTELYTMQRYLQYERLQELNMTHFDCWASRFGETVTALELAPEGTGYRARTRFSKFFNLPELMNLFKEVADSIKRLENSFITILKQFRDWLAIIFGRLLMEEMESCIWGMCIMDSVCCLLKIKK